MAESTSRICKGLALFGHELPVVAPSVKRNFQHTKRSPIPHFTIGLGRTNGPVRIFAAPSNYKLANTVGGIQFPIGILRGEPLIIMIMPVDNYVGSGMKENAHNGFICGLFP